MKIEMEATEVIKIIKLLEKAAECLMPYADDEDDTDPERNALLDGLLITSDNLFCKVNSDVFHGELSSDDFDTLTGCASRHERDNDNE